MALAEMPGGKDEATKFPEIKQPILYSDANGSAQKAIADIQAFKNQGVDILLILPDQGPALYNTIAAATAAGVITVPALIGMDPKGDPKYGTLTNDPKAYSCYVDTDSVVWGQAYGAYIAQNITTGNGFFLGGPAGNSYSSGVFKGMTEYLAKNAPGVKMQGPTWTGWDLQKGAAAAQTLVSQMDSVDVITADYGAMLEPVIDAIKALGKPLPKVVAIQDYNGARKVWSQNNKSFKLGITGARTFGIRIALDAGLALKRGENVCSLSQWSIQSTPVQRYASRELSMTCVPSFPQYQMDMYDCATDPTRGGYAADQPDEYYFDIGLSADALKQVFSK
jgi:ribose transport system substrate-binding protein